MSGNLFIKKVIFLFLLSFQISQAQKFVNIIPDPLCEPSQHTNQSDCKCTLTESESETDYENNYSTLIFNSNYKPKYNKVNYFTPLIEPRLNSPPI